MQDDQSKEMKLDNKEKSKSEQKSENHISDESLGFKDDGSLDVSDGVNISTAFLINGN